MSDRGDGLIDGAFGTRLDALEAAIVELTYRLADSEAAAAYGPGHGELPMVRRGVYRGEGLERKVPYGHLADREVRRYRIMSKAWQVRLRKLVAGFEQDL